MKKQISSLGKWAVVALLVLPNTTQAQETDEDVFMMNPFVVEAPDEKSYTINETLAGTRVKTDVRDLAASISTVSEFFLEDTNSTGQEDLLVYTTNTEVGGLGGNFSGLGNTGNLNENLIAPHTNTRVRGLSQADNTRNYFRTDIPWDSYNTEAVTIQRGPNSVLFGVAGPAGVINSSLKMPVFDNKYEYINMIDEFGRVRHVLDLNHEILDEELAVRFIGVRDDESFRQEEAYKDTERYYGAISYQPRLLGENEAPLNITIHGETGEIDANSPRFTPPQDNITAWLDPNRLNRRTFHPHAAWEYGIVLDRGTRVNNDYPQFWEPWVGQQIPGVQSANPTAIIDNLTGEIHYRALANWDRSALGPDGEIDGNLLGFDQQVRLLSVAPFNEYAQNLNAIAPGSFPGAATFWKNKVLTDPDVFDFYNHLIDGNNKNEWTDWDAYNVSLSQVFWKNRVGVEFVYDYQELTRGGTNYYQNVLSVDINSHLFIGEPTDGSYVTTWPGALETPPNPDLSQPMGGVPNPNAGRAYVSGGRPFTNELNRERENYRWTAFLDLDSKDFFEEDSTLAWILGRHTLTGLYQEETIKSNNSTYLPFAVDVDWPGQFRQMDPNLGGYNRQVPYMTYLSGDLTNASVENGLGITTVRGQFNPSGQVSVGYFDNTWNAPGVDPGAEWIRPLDGEVLTQSENPSNYVGWTQGFFNVLNAEKGDINSLYTAGSRTIEEITSRGITWQGRLFGGIVIPTVGYREDEVVTSSETAPEIDALTKVVDPHFKLVPDANNTSEIEGELTTWGVVLRSPDFINEHLPIIDNFTLFYNKSENLSAENRVGFSGNDLPAPSGESEDIGFTISALEGRLNIKATWYETSQLNAAIPGGNPLGDNSWYLANQFVWQIGHALKMEAYHRGEDIGGYTWYYNYAWPDDGYAYDANTLPPEGFDHPSLAAQREMWQAVYNNLLPQEWYDAYGFPVDVSKLQSDDWETRKQGITDPAFGPNTANNPVSIQPSGGGLIRGQSPIGTINQRSEGFELEVTARITPNWNVYLNASKVEAERGAIGEDFVNFLQTMRANYDSPAGDIRQWWAGDRPAREFFNDFIWQPFLFQQEAEGLPAAEIRPWRYNLVTSYSFEEGVLKGLRLGLGYRWEDDLIVGNELNDALDNLDPSRPIHGGSESHLDLWVGYSRQLSDAVFWDIQVNVKNVGEDQELIPVSVNPDGEFAAMRITEGMYWEIRNTFSF